MEKTLQTWTTIQNGENGFFVVKFYYSATHDKDRNISVKFEYAETGKLEDYDFNDDCFFLNNCCYCESEKLLAVTLFNLFNFTDLDMLFETAKTAIIVNYEKSIADGTEWKTRANDFRHALDKLLKEYKVVISKTLIWDETNKNNLANV